MSEDANKTEDKADKMSLYLEPYVDDSVAKYKKKKKVWRIALLSIAGLILLVYIGGVIYHFNYFALYTEINGYDVSGESVKEVQEQFDDILNSYVLDVIFKNGNEKIAVGDGALKVTLNKSVKQIKMEQNPFLWFLHMITPEDYKVTYDVDYDKSKMKNLIDSFDCMQNRNMSESVDAYVKMQDGEVVVVDDKTGTSLNKDAVYDCVYSALSDMSSSVDIEDSGCYINALIRTDSELIDKRVKKADSYLNINGRINIDSTQIEITPEELSQLAYIDSNGNIAISTNNVRVYAENFVKKYNTSYSERKFKTHDGKTISVYGGYYGWEFDTEQLANDLYEALCGMRDFEIEAPYYHRGYVFKDGDDIGDSYVEIDLSNQHVYVYMNGKNVYDADCVTGNVRAGHSTPGGLFGLTYKTTNAVLKGEDYESNVSYWMPFNGGIGMHDATWRSRFGGEIYLTDGSHGCVNLQYYDAAAIYDYVETNFPIVCYWRE